MERKYKLTEEGKLLKANMEKLKELSNLLYLESTNETFYDEYEEEFNYYTQAEVSLHQIGTILNMYFEDDDVIEDYEELMSDNWNVFNKYVK